MWTQTRKLNFKPLYQTSYSRLKILVQGLGLNYFISGFNLESVDWTMYSPGTQTDIILIFWINPGGIIDGIKFEA